MALNTKNDAQRPELGLNIKKWPIQAAKRPQGETQHQVWLYSGNENRQGLKSDAQSLPKRASARESQSPRLTDDTNCVYFALGFLCNGVCVFAKTSMPPLRSRVTRQEYKGHWPISRFLRLILHPLGAQSVLGDESLQV